MLSGTKRNQTKKKGGKPKANGKIKDYGNDPFFEKKAAESKIFLEKHGFPKDLLVKK